MVMMQVELLLKDIVRLFKSLPPRVRSVEEFEQFWEAQKTEYLHYAGSDVTHAARPHAVTQLLDISAAYLFIPVAVAPRSREFGLLLSYFFFFTQPLTPRRPIQISSAVAESLINPGETPGFLADVALVLFEHSAWHIVPFVDIGASLRAVLAEHEKQQARIVWGSSDPFSADADDETLQVEAELEEYDRAMRSL